MTQEAPGGNIKACAPDDPVHIYMKRLGHSALLEDVCVSAFGKTEKEAKKQVFLAVHRELLDVRKRADSGLEPLADVTAKRIAGDVVDPKDIKTAVLILKSFNLESEKVIGRQGRKLLRELPASMKGERTVVEDVLKFYPAKKTRTTALVPSPQ